MAGIRRELRNASFFTGFSGEGEWLYAETSSSFGDMGGLFETCQPGLPGRAEMVARNAGKEIAERSGSFAQATRMA